MTDKTKAIFLLLAAGVAACATVAAFKNLHHLQSRPVPTELYEQYESNREEAVYYLRSADGYLAVYDASNTRKPLQVTDIDIESLPGGDRAMLEKGIPVASREELLKLLEDFGS
mgnify:CR=1 FL=1